MTEKIAGELEINHDEGIIYFHDKHTGMVVLKISHLPIPIPEAIEPDGTFMSTPLVLTWGHGVNWQVSPVLKVSENMVDFHLIGQKHWSERALESLDHSKVRNMARLVRQEATEAKSEGGDTAMIMIDDEADGLYLLSVAIEDNDSRGMERAYYGLEDKTRNTLWQNCVKLS